MKDKILDIFQFREGTEEESDGSVQPIITAGSVVWGIMFRSFILIMLTFFFMAYFDTRDNIWLVSLFLIWGLAVYPGWRQYQIFNKRIERIEDETMCGSCRHFESTGQLCRIHDEHISKNYLPCEGQDWEAQNKFS
jgi:hypothetical protein